MRQWRGFAVSGPAPGCATVSVASPRLAPIAVALLLTLALLAGRDAGAQRARPTHTRPPHGATVLFDGKNADQWIQLDGSPVKWQVQAGDLVVVPGTGNIVTREKFGDYRLHLEFNIPLMPNATGQGRGNSGVYNQGLYEVQVLDSYNNPTYKAGGCGAIYGQRDPDHNMSLPPGQWQSYDIWFRAPHFDDTGRVTELPRITVVWNGVTVHHNVTIHGPTLAGMGSAMLPSGPLMLQDHGAPVRYRNIWIQPRR